MAGRPRKHAAVHLLDGTSRPCRHDNGADTLPAKGECAPTRRLNDHGSREFITVLGAYPPGTLGESDSEPLTQYCEWVQRMFALRVQEDELGVMRIKEAAEISKHCLQFASRFGLTPADRGKVKLSGPTEGQAKEAKFFGVTG